MIIDGRKYPSECSLTTERPRTIQYMGHSGLVKYLKSTSQHWAKRMWKQVINLVLEGSIRLLYAFFLPLVLIAYLVQT